MFCGIYYDGLAVFLVGYGLIIFLMGSEDCSWCFDCLC